MELKQPLTSNVKVKIEGKGIVQTGEELEPWNLTIGILERYFSLEESEKYTRG